MIETKLILQNLWRAVAALRKNSDGQDLVEYALTAGFIVVAVITLSPEIADSFTTVMSKVNSIMVKAGTT